IKRCLTGDSQMRQNKKDRVFYDYLSGNLSFRFDNPLDLSTQMVAKITLKVKTLYNQGSTEYRGASAASASHFPPTVQAMTDRARRPEPGNRQGDEHSQQSCRTDILSKIQKSASNHIYFVAQ
ncbi:MAG: hypothetical protein Q7S31_00140, partial [bacterium]|nr:hypothetical protein [bacterium]